jgi:hypothetical protein
MLNAVSSVFRLRVYLQHHKDFLKSIKELGPTFPTGRDYASGAAISGTFAGTVVTTKNGAETVAAVPTPSIDGSSAETGWTVSTRLR